MLSIGQPHPAQPQEIDPEYEIGVLQSQIARDRTTSETAPRKLATGSWLSAA